MFLGDECNALEDVTQCFRGRNSMLHRVENNAIGRVHMLLKGESNGVGEQNYSIVIPSPQ